MENKIIITLLGLIYAVGCVVGFSACSHKHEYTEQIITPTCTERGYIVFSCECGETYNDNFTDAMGHDLVSHEGKAATCTESGWEQYVTCSRCDYSNYKEIAVTGHDFVDWVTFSASLPDKEGIEKRVCKTCGHAEYRGTPVNENNRIVVFDTANAKMGRVEGEKIQVVAVGSKTTEVTAIANIGYKFVQWNNGETDPTISVTVSESTTVIAYFQIELLELPVMVINTENSAPILDKENYVNCEVSVINAEQEYCFDDKNAGIKGRGNSTWTFPKKPYKLKFDKKIDLFGNGKAKKWVVIGDCYDASLVRNYLTYNIAGELLENLKYTTSTQPIEIYLNSEYLGVYLLCEQQEVGETRVNISEDFKNSQGEAEVDVGYLLEMDFRAPDEGVVDKDYFYVDGFPVPFALKSPDTEDINKEGLDISLYINFIKLRLENCYAALIGNDFDEIIRCIDVDSFVDGYIIDELVNLSDQDKTSFYLYYDSSDKLIHRGSIWDYDGSIGNAWNIVDIGGCDPENLYAKKNITWYNYLLKFDSFKNKVANRLSELAKENKLIECIDKNLAEVYSNSGSYLRNFIRWEEVIKNAGYIFTDEISKIKTWQGHVEYVRDWLTKSLNYMLSVYCE